MKYLSVGLFLLFSGAVVAQDAQTITFGAVDLRLGMMQDQAVASLSKYYTLSPVNSASGQGVFWILPQGARIEDLEKTLGSITFKEARLMAITKKWIANPGSANDLVLALYGLARGTPSKERDYMQARDGRTGLRGWRRYSHRRDLLWPSKKDSGGVVRQPTNFRL